MNTPKPEAGPVLAEPTPYELGITCDPDAAWPVSADGQRLSPEATAAHFEFDSVAEMEAAAEEARDAFIDAEVEAGLEREALEADGELGSYPTFDDDPARWGLKHPAPQSAAELEREAELEAWGPEGPYASYAEWLADGRSDPEPEAGL